MSMNEKVPIVIAGRNLEVEVEGLLPMEVSSIARSWCTPRPVQLVLEYSARYGVKRRRKDSRKALRFR